MAKKQDSIAEQYAQVKAELEACKTQNLALARENERLKQGQVPRQIPSDVDDICGNLRKQITSLRAEFAALQVETHKNTHIATELAEQRKSLNQNLILVLHQLQRLVPIEITAEDRNKLQNAMRECTDYAVHRVYGLINDLENKFDHYNKRVSIPQRSFWSAILLIVILFIFMCYMIYLNQELQSDHISSAVVRCFVAVALLLVAMLYKSSD